MDEAIFSRTIGLYREMAKDFRACPKPIVAAIHGYALAGGFELACLCDIRIAAEGTLFGLPDTPLGLSPTSGMTYLLPRIVGLGRALDLTLSAQNIDTAEAHRIGFVTRVVEDRRLPPRRRRPCEGRVLRRPRIELRASDIRRARRRSRLLPRPRDARAVPEIRRAEEEQVTMRPSTRRFAPARDKGGLVRPKESASS
jgi:enoyl-CoA hydratase/carnithine racemase